MQKFEQMLLKGQSISDERWCKNKMVWPASRARSRPPSFAKVKLDGKSEWSGAPVVIVVFPKRDKGGGSGRVSISDGADGIRKTTTLLKYV